MDVRKILNKRFRGALVGVLVGDCYGAPFERFVGNIDPQTILKRIESMSSQNDEIFHYTDDTAMTMSTCKSLIENKGLNAKHLAREYSESYFREPHRGYGLAVREVFKLLRERNYQDPFGPATNQFSGSGSYGNGAAMRSVGIGLFAYKNHLNDQDTMNLIRSCSMITHSHIYGINGAAMLAIAIKYVLGVDDDGLDENNFLAYMVEKMNDLEDSGDKMYVGKLNSIIKIWEKLTVSGADVSQSEIVDLLGNDVAAHRSVPLAIYSFLRGISKFNDSYRIEDEFIRTLHWAISCGGDTDTIASMACGLCGAYLGIDKIPENIYNKCESWQEVLSLADKMLDS